MTLLEQYDVTHTHGSSHGSSRIFRFSYEDQDYVDLGVEAQGLWRTLEAESGRSLVAQVGCVDHGPREVVEPVHAALRGARGPVRPRVARGGAASGGRSCASTTWSSWSTRPGGSTRARPSRPCTPRPRGSVPTSGPGARREPYTCGDDGVEVVTDDGHGLGVGGGARGRGLAARDAR